MGAVVDHAHDQLGSQAKHAQAETRRVINSRLASHAPQSISHYDHG